MTTRAIMWFRRDLRLGDHPAILAAAADGAEVVPVHSGTSTLKDAINEALRVWIFGMILKARFA